MSGVDSFQIVTQVIGNPTGNVQTYQTTVQTLGTTSLVKAYGVAVMVLGNTEAPPQVDSTHRLINGSLIQ